MPKNFFVRYKSIIFYLFFGVCTTMVNFFVYFLCAYPLHFPMWISTIIAWSLAVTFAFVTNKKWVFESGSWEKNVIIGEAISFFLCRLMTGGMDLVIMFVCVGFMGWNDLVMKILSNVLVIVFNYIASKMVIFKKDGGNILYGSSIEK